jgi:predicted DNA-binding protein
MKGSTQTTIRAHINIFLGSVALLFAATATAGVILKIDIANPDEIKFIATNVSSLIDIEDDSGFASAALGITLKDVLAADPGSPLSISGTLSPLDKTAYNTVDIVPLSADDYPSAINIYYDGPDPQPQGFTTSRQALAGDSTVTTDSGSFTLKDVSSKGDIVAGFSPDFGGVSKRIGQWEIIDSSNVEQDFDVDGLSYTTVGMPDGEVQVTGRASGNTATDIVIPATVVDSGTAYSVTTIGIDAFLSNALTSVTIPDSVTTIGEGAFADNALTSVIIGNSVTTIEDFAFSNNDTLTSVIIPDSVTTIGERAFANNALTSVIIGNSVTTIEDFAFSDNALTSVIIPDSVTTIGEGAFANNALTSVIIPDGVTTIGDSAFANNALTSVIIGNSVTTIEDYAFAFNALTSVIIGNSVTTIEDFAFADNALTSVIIPDSVTTIGVEAFNDNELTSAAFKGGFGDFSLNMFDTNPTLATITYCEGTSGWPQGFNNGSTTIVTTEMPCSTAVDPALIWLLLRPQVLDEE